MFSRKFDFVRAPRFAALCLCVVVLTDGLHNQAAAQLDLGGLLKPFAFGADDLVSLLNMQRPDSSFPEQTQHKQQALTDDTNDEIFMSTSQKIIERSGFKQKTYHVISKDGYITEMINVKNPEADESQLKQPPVMIFHGGATDTNTWLWGSAIQHHPEKYPRTAADGPITSSNRSLGMMLVNYGYNVWLVATRGSNRQNLGHTTLRVKLLEDILLDPLNPEALREISDTLKFFEFSQDELVDYEFPAQIEKCLNLTGSSKVSTITYSFSTQIMFKILASNKELAKKIYTNVAIEPLLDRIGMNTVVNGILDFAMTAPIPVGNLVAQLLLTDFTREFLRSLDRYSIFYYLITQVVGPSPRFQTFLEDPLLGHLLLPVSIVEYRQYGQQTLVSLLQKLDHGPVKNLELYGQATPPIYHIPDIKIKRWMMISGDTDTLGTLSSADKYAALIPNKPYNYIRRLNGWNHLDSVASFDNDRIVNLPIMDFLDNFSSLNRTQIAKAVS